jgi:hypothetical protein
MPQVYQKSSLYVYHISSLTNKRLHLSSFVISSIFIVAAHLPKHNFDISSLVDYQFPWPDMHEATQCIQLVPSKTLQLLLNGKDKTFYIPPVLAVSWCTTSQTGAFTIDGQYS